MLKMGNKNKIRETRKLEIEIQVDIKAKISSIRAFSCV